MKKAFCSGLLIILVSCGCGEVNSIPPTRGANAAATVPVRRTAISANPTAIETVIGTAIETTTVIETTITVADGGVKVDVLPGTDTLPDALPSVDATPLPDLLPSVDVKTLSDLSSDVKVAPDLSPDLRSFVRPDALPPPSNDRCIGKPDDTICSDIPFCDAGGWFIVGIDACQSGICTPRLFSALKCPDFNCIDDNGVDRLAASVKVTWAEVADCQRADNPYQTSVIARVFMRKGGVIVTFTDWRCPDAVSIETSYNAQMLATRATSSSRELQGYKLTDCKPSL